MNNKKEWYSRNVEGLLKDLSDACHYTIGLARVMYIYSWTNELMQLRQDLKKCESYITKQIIQDRMQEIISELKHYKIFDDRFEELFDEGGVND